MKIKVKDTAEFKHKLLVCGHSQRSLARAINISEPYANQIVNGVRNPGPVIARKIVELLGCKFEDIFFVDEDSKSKQTTA